MLSRVAKLNLPQFWELAERLSDDFYELQELNERYEHDVRDVVGKLLGIKDLLIAFYEQMKDSRALGLTREVVKNGCREAEECTEVLEVLAKVYDRSTDIFNNSRTKSNERHWLRILSGFYEYRKENLTESLHNRITGLSAIWEHLKTHMNSIGPPASSHGRPELSRLRSTFTLSNLHYDSPPVSSHWQTGAMPRRDSSDRKMRYGATHPAQMPPSPPLSADSPPLRSYTTPPAPKWGPPPSSTDSYARYPPRLSGSYDQRSMTPMSPVSPTSPNGVHTFYQLNRRNSNQSSPISRYHGMSMPPSPISPTELPKVAESYETQPSVSRSRWQTLIEPEPGSTPLPAPTGERKSVCGGPPMDNITKDFDDEELMTFTFDHEIRVRFVQNQGTKATKIVCTKGGGHIWHPGHRGMYELQTQMEAHHLTIVRYDSTLHLSRGNLRFARLCFKTSETMVIFKCVFLALRSQGPNGILASAEESYDPAKTLENIHFSGRIMDEGYVHKIRVLEDIQSGAVRIAAARGDGSSDVTVWTAFVTEHILRPDFMARGSDGTVTLRGIRRLSFSDVFETKYFNHFPLKFRAREDATLFQEAIKKLARHRLELQRPSVSRSPSAYRNPYKPPVHGYHTSTDCFTQYAAQPYY